MVIIIPVQNIRNLHLPDEIIESVKKKEFHIYAVNTIDEGIEISNIKEIIIIYTDIFEKNYYYNKFKNKNGKFEQVKYAIFDKNRTEKNKVKMTQGKELK